MEIKYSCQGHPLAYTRFGDPLPVDENGELRWHIANWGTDMARFEQIGIINNAFQWWNRYMPAFDFISTEKRQEAKWIIYWAKDDIITFPDGSKMDSPFSFTQNPGVLAVQYASPNLVCVINDDYDYSLNTPGPNVFDLLGVLKHEFGHGMGFGHSPNPDSIMGAIYKKGNGMTPDDIQGILDVQGPLMMKFLRKPNMLMIGKLYGVPEPIEKSQNKGCLGLLL